MKIIGKGVVTAHEQKRNQYMEYNITKKDGEVIYAICVVEYVNEDRICCHVMSVGSRSFHTERQSFIHGVFDSLSDNTEIGMYIRSVNGNDKNYVLFNKITKELYGADDVTKSKCWNQQQEDAEDELCVEHNAPMVFEREVVDAKGVNHYLRVTKRLVRTKDGYRYINATMTDLTELKQKSDTLQEAVINLELALEASKLLAWKYDPKQNRIMIINSEFSTSLEKCVGLLEPQYREQCMTMFDNLLSGKSDRESMEFNLMNENGSTAGRFVSEMAVVKDKKGKVSYIVGNRRDVSQEYQLQKEIRDNLQIMNAIYENTPIGISYLNRDGYLIKMNPAYHKILGQVNQYNRTHNPISMFEDEHLSEDVKQSLRNGESVGFVLSPDMTKSLQEGDTWCDREAKVIYLDIKVIALRSANGDVEGYISICTDITDVTESNNRIADLHQQRETILQMLPVGVELYNPDGWLTYQNNMAKSLFGCGDIRYKVNIMDNPNMPSGLYERSLRGEDISFEVKYDFDKIVTGNTYETEHKGKIKYMRVTAKAIKDLDNVIMHYVAIISDVTESVENRKRIEDNIMKLNMIIENSALVPWDYDRLKRTFMPYDLKDNQLKRRDSLNKDYMDVTLAHPDNKDEILRCIALMDRGVDDRFSIDIKYKWIEESEDAPWRSGTLAGQPFERDESGKVVKYIGFLKDTTQFVRLNEELVRLNVQNQLVLNNTQSGFIYFTPDYKVLWENVSLAYPNIKQAHLYKQGLTCHLDVKGEQEPCKNCVLPLAIKNRKVYSQEVQFPDGLFMELIVTPVLRDDGELEGVVMRVEDVTERKRINMELKQAKEKAEQSNQLKSAFLANMSHEIRTPLNSIVGFSNIVMDTDDEAEREEYRKIISTNSDMLLNLINDILDLSKIESGYLEIVPGIIDMAELFSELGVSFARRLKEGVELECVSPYVECMTFGMDKQRVLQIMTNYLSNAMKFTRQGMVTIGYEVTEAEDGVLIYVKDTGIGISEQNKTKVFQRFQKFDSFAQGTGLGLSICRAMADAMHGEVGFESQEGVGSRFWAKIPCQVKSLVTNVEDKMSEKERYDAHTEYEAEAVVAVKASKRLRILIAENDNDNYLLIKGMLKQHRLTRAVNGNEVVAYADNDEYDVVVMAAEMPHMNGYESTAEIRKFNNAIPIIAVVGSSLEVERERALKAGCNEVVVRPVDRDKLLQVIMKLV